MLFKCTKCGKTLELQTEAQSTNCPFDSHLMTKVDKDDQLVNEDSNVYILNEDMV